MASILVVDDNATNRKLVLALLSHDGHVTFEACDGSEALEVAAASRPQLVISDILMPSMDGFEFLRRLRAAPQLRHIPVIFHTAHYHEREAQKLASDCGAARVLLKPCPAATLLQAVEQVLAGVSESHVDTLSANFDREHLLLMTNKLAQKVDALGASNARLTALASLNVDVVAELDPQPLLQKVCDGARSLFGSRFAVLAVSDGNIPESVLFALSGIDSGGVPLEPPQLHSGRLGEVLSERRLWRASGAEASGIEPGFPTGYPSAGAFLAVPLASPTRAYGWLCLADKVGATGFEAEDEALLSILGAQFGRYHEIACERLSVQHHTSRIYALLSGVVTLVTRMRTPTEVCVAACQLAVQQGGFGLAGIGRMKPDTGEFLPIASAGAAEDFAEFSRGLSAATRLQENLVAAALRSGQPSVCNDLEFFDPRLPGREALLTRGYRAIVILPLLLSGASAAYLLLGSRASEVFDGAEMRLLSELSRGISLALDGVEHSAG